MRGVRSLARSAKLVAALAVAPRAALALEPGTIDGEPVRVDVTVASSVIQSADNRNSRVGSVARRLDDDWGVWYDRLTTQASFRSFQAGLRLDSAWFYTTRSSTGVALDLLDERRGGRGGPYTADDATFFVQKTVEASRDLATRFTSWVYPAKYYVSYSGRALEATAGDFYAQLGRGLVLNVRKQDELSSDTTVRGARATVNLREGSYRMRLTALGGALNPLRLDESSGRYLGVTRAVTPGLLAIAEAGMPRAQASPFEERAAPTYAPDTVVGAQLEGGGHAVQIGVQGALVGRTPSPEGGTGLSPSVTRTAESLGNGSISVTAPDLGGIGEAYLEVAGQRLTYPSGTDRSALPESGHAVYASGSATLAAVTLTAEGRHYRRFFAIPANVDLGRTPEFSALQYSAPPTTEAFWVDTEYGAFNTCVTGGRLKSDVQLGRHVTVVSWVGHHRTWAESVANERCDTARTNENRVWDVASGLVFLSTDRKTRLSFTFVARTDDAGRDLPLAAGGETRIFYREAYLRHDATVPLGGPFALKAQGFERRRHQTQSGLISPWIELTEIFAVEWAARLTVGGSVEYTGNPQFPPTYFSGTLGYALGPASSLSLFVGQRRGGLRCVSGVCRVFPPFEGARLDATFRF